jgi:hypothetical protein
MCSISLKEEPMQKPTTKRLLSTLTAALATAFVAVPLAHARLAVDARHTALVNRHEIQVDARHAALLQKHGAVRPGSLQTIPAPEQTTVVAGGQFDWGDAGIGAAAGIGLALLAGGGVLVTRAKLVSA